MSVYLWTEAGEKFYNETLISQLKDAIEIEGEKNEEDYGYLIKDLKSVKYNQIVSIGDESPSHTYFLYLYYTYIKGKSGITVDQIKNILISDGFIYPEIDPQIDAETDPQIDADTDNNIEKLKVKIYKRIKDNKLIFDPNGKNFKDILNSSIYTFPDYIYVRKSDSNKPKFYPLYKYDKITKWVYPQTETELKGMYKLMVQGRSGWLWTRGWWDAEILSKIIYIDDLWNTDIYRHLYITFGGLSDFPVDITIPFFELDDGIHYTHDTSTGTEDFVTSVKDIIDNLKVHIYKTVDDNKLIYNENGKTFEEIEVDNSITFPKYMYLYLGNKFYAFLKQKNGSHKSPYPQTEKELEEIILMIQIQTGKQDFLWSFIEDIFGELMAISLPLSISSSTHDTDSVSITKNYYITKNGIHFINEILSELKFTPKVGDELTNVMIDKIIVFANEDDVDKKFIIDLMDQVLITTFQDVAKSSLLDTYYWWSNKYDIPVNSKLTYSQIIDRANELGIYSVKKVLDKLDTDNLIGKEKTIYDYVWTTAGVWFLGLGHTGVNVELGQLIKDDIIFKLSKILGIESDNKFEYPQRIGEIMPISISIFKDSLIVKEGQPDIPYKTYYWTKQAEIEGKIKFGIIQGNEIDINILVNICKEEDTSIASLIDTLIGDYITSVKFTSDGTINKLKYFKWEITENNQSIIKPNDEELADNLTKAFGIVENIFTKNPFGNEKLKVDITLEDANGDVLGTGGPDPNGEYYLTKSFNTFRPKSGVMTIYTKALRVKNEDYIIAVLIHETFHILGIGTLWKKSFRFRDTPIKPYEGRKYYTGQNGLCEYKKLVGDQRLIGIPIENDGGVGSADGHLEKDNINVYSTVFNTSTPYLGLQHELMTNSMSNDVKWYNIISRVSIGILEDMGYPVNYIKETKNFKISSLITATVSSLVEKKEEIPKILDLNQGWNFISFPITKITNISEFIVPEILEIKDGDKVYTSEVPIFSTLLEVKPYKAYFVNSSKKISISFN